jgi:arsenite transporter
MRNKSESPESINFFEKWLTLWVALCMVLGVGLGRMAPHVIHWLGSLDLAQVNVPVAMFVWVMIIPMLIRVDVQKAVQVKSHWRGIAVTVGINWLVKPFSMALLGWVFLQHVFAHGLSPHEIDQYMAGLIILSAAPCTAMVFVWSNLCKGDANFTLTQVALNDIIMIFAFAPIVGLLLGMTDIHVPWNTLFYSVLIYIIVPFVIAQTIRAVMLHQGPARLDALLKRLHPVSLIGLLAMLVLLFSFQGNALLNHPVVVLLIAVPIIIQVYSNSMLAYGLNKWVGEAHAVAGPSALIGASNFFELAVATAISVFGFHSGAALATVVGVLVEVPVMLSVVRIVMRSKVWFNQRH